MKKTIVILSALLALVACNKNNAEQPIAPSYTYDITITRADDTKAVKSDWTTGDVVYVFFSNVAAPKYLKLTYDGSAWTRTQYNGATAESFTYPGNGTMTAIYLPYGNDAVVSAEGTSFKFNKTFTSYFLKAEKAAYTVSGTTVSGTLNMVAPEGFVQFAMPMYGTINKNITKFFRISGSYTLSDSNLKPVSFASVAADGSISITEGAEGEPITGYVKYVYFGQGLADINFSGVLKSTANGTAADYAFKFEHYEYTAATVVTYLLSGNKTLSYKDAIKFPTIDNSAWKVPEPEYVEINGVKWATWNVGASAVGGYGDYFELGAIYPRDKYLEEYYEEGSITGNLTNEKDVAFQKLGPDWHMPTKADFASIVKTNFGSAYLTPADGVTWNPITDTSIYGTKGVEVYETANPSKKIFFPHAGTYSTTLTLAGTSNAYRTATDYNDYYLSYTIRNTEWGSPSSRYKGYSVRPVHN